MSSADLIALAQQLAPTGKLADCVSYTGADLVWAQPLEQAELDALYQPPAPEFKARLGFNNRAFWEELAAGNVEVLRWVYGGYSEFVEKVVPTIRRANNPNTQLHTEFVTEAVQELLGVGATTDVTQLQFDNEVVRVIAPLTVDVKENGKRRLCWNGRPINPYLPTAPFKMEHAEAAAKLMRARDFMFTLDMKAGYHQVPVKPWFRKLLCFEWQGRVYQWQVLPFGLSTAPRAFTKLCRQLLQRWRAKGVRCSNYIDDFIFFAPTLARALELRAMVLADLTALGWFISPGKSMLQPGTMVEYLGLVFCSLPEPHIRVPEQKVAKVTGLFKGVLRKAAEVGAEGVAKGMVRTTGTHLAKALGFLQSIKLAVPLVSVLMRELYSCLNRLPKDEDGAFVYPNLVPLTGAAVEECRFWKSALPRWNGFAVARVAVSRVLYTDGCADGFGALVHRVLGRAEEEADQLLGGSWEADMSPDSVVTELEGLWRSVVAAGGDLYGQTVLHRTDSISTYSVVIKGGTSRSERLTDVVRRLQIYCILHNISLASQYVGAGVIIRSGADAMSRSADVSDGGKLNPRVFERLWRVWGPFEADMFASAATVQHDPAGEALPYWSMFADGTSMGVDALAADWGSMGRVFAFPPIGLVGSVLRLAREQRARVLLIVPDRPSQRWWPVLQESAAMEMVDLARLHVPHLDGPLFVQGRRDLKPHPLGDYEHAESVRWLAVWIQP
jgi:hypothetical protein